MTGPNGGIAVGGNVSATAPTGGNAVIATGNVTIGITLEQYEAGLKQKEQEIRAELSQASAADKEKIALLTNQLADIQNKLKNPERALEDYKAKLVQTYNKREISPEQIKQAQDALTKDETTDAERLSTQTPTRSTDTENAEVGRDHRLGRNNLQESQLAKVDSDAKQSQLAKVDFTTQVLNFLGVSATSGAQRGVEAEFSGDIWVADLDTGTRSRLTQEGGYHSPVFTPGDEGILALKGDELWFIPLSGGEPEKRVVIPGIMKLVGFHKQDKDKLLILFEGSRGATVGILSFKDGKISTENHLAGLPPPR